MKAIWQGVLSLALLSIPIKLYPAVASQYISFRTLHDADKAPLKFKRVCTKCGQEVAWENVVKGFEYEKGKYFALTKAQLKELKPARSDIIEVLGFVNRGTIHPIWHCTNYYAAPAKARDRAFALLKEILSLTAKDILCKIVLRDKEYTALLQPYKLGMLLTTLNYAYEIRQIERIPELAQPAPALKKSELELAKELVKKFSIDEPRLEKYRDTFAEQLKALIAKLLRGEKIVVKKPAPKKTLMAALRASLK